MLTSVLLILLLSIFGRTKGNLPPIFSTDIDGITVSEDLPVGTVVYTLNGSDPEGGPVRYGLEGTDLLAVNPVTGDITVAKPLDYEANDTLRITVTLEDQVEQHENNKVRLQVSVIVLDVNDNAPVFIGEPFEASVKEDAPIGTIILKNIQVQDADLGGPDLTVACEPKEDFPDSCEMFEIVTHEATSRSWYGSLKTLKKLDYARSQFYQLTLRSSDGTHKSRAGVEVKLIDVQDSPPEFVGSMTGLVAENASIGSLVLTIVAKDRDRGEPRPVRYELLTNPDESLLLDSKTGELRTARPLDRESLEGGVLRAKVRAREVDSDPNDIRAQTTAEVTVTVTDVNDEAPRFNRAEYHASVLESAPPGSPLPGLDMTVTDSDLGSNAAFSLRLIDVSGSFEVEPRVGVGSTAVSIRLANATLDFEDPNQRKFIILVVAEETATEEHLSSTATVTVSVLDENDNSPTFVKEAYSASVLESAAGGSHVATVTARDRDAMGTGGVGGLRYTLLGQGAERFTIDPRTGLVSVAPCATPGRTPCLDAEVQHMYFLSVRATDEGGKGRDAVVPLRVTLIDDNDNPPTCETPLLHLSAEEGATRLEPDASVTASDLDKTSTLRYSVEGLAAKILTVDSESGFLGVASKQGLPLPPEPLKPFLLNIQVSDGRFKANCSLQLVVRDVNNNKPEFESNVYESSIAEDTPIGTTVEQVHALDADAGENARVTYRIDTGSFDSFQIDPITGAVTTISKLDYDKRSKYELILAAVDGGTTALTGTTTLIINLLNRNDKLPIFVPAFQRASIAEDVSIGTKVHLLTATDPDAGPNGLRFTLSGKVTAIDQYGKHVPESEVISNLFEVLASGNVTVKNALSRDIAAVVTLPVTVTDTSADTKQTGEGSLVITVVGVNKHPPRFRTPWSDKNPHLQVTMAEEQPIGAIVGTFPAVDDETPALVYRIEPESPYFEVDSANGEVKLKKRLDYEKVHQVAFTLLALDSGVPQRTATALINVLVQDINDNEPIFTQAVYEAAVQENALPGTPVVRVSATDADGPITYTLSSGPGTSPVISKAFEIDTNTGQISVRSSESLDRETNTNLRLQVTASDGHHSQTALVRVRLLDLDDNSPIFTQKVYHANALASVTLQPAPALVQVRAEDKDEGSAGMVRYSLTGDAESLASFRLDPESGFVYPTAGIREHGPREYHLKVEARDGNGQGIHTDQAMVIINVTAANQNPPVFLMPAQANATVEVPADAGLPGYLVMQVKATDEDAGPNGQVTYHLRVGTENVQETSHFLLGRDTGELKAKTVLADNSSHSQPPYQLVLVARDQGQPSAYETLRFLTVILVGAPSPSPEFESQRLPFRFFILENRPPGTSVGQVQAQAGPDQRIDYRLLVDDGSEAFSLDRDGTLRLTMTLDREVRDVYNLKVEATTPGGSEAAIANVIITVLDENDNPPKFEVVELYGGVSSSAGPGERITSLSVSDADAGNDESVMLEVNQALLFRGDSQETSGAVVPVPFKVSRDGHLETAGYMAEYAEARFVVEVEARETAPPHRTARCQIFIWVTTPGQLVRIVISRLPEAVHSQEKELLNALSSITHLRIVLDDVRYHPDRRWTDVFVHAVDPSTSQVVSVDQLLTTIDAKYDDLKASYHQYRIENVFPAVTTQAEPPTDPALAALAALTVVLLVGLVTFGVVCCCLRHWVLPVSGPQPGAKQALISKELAEAEGATTDNPLWIEQKLKLYEEQELTMQVFCEPEGGASVGGESVNPPSPIPDNTYATIRRGSPPSPQYATLNAHTLGQHRTQQLTVNKDGQPELVAELI